MGAAMAGQPGEATTDGAAGNAHVPGRGPGRPEQTAPGVYRVETGRGLTEANVYLVRSGPGWVLIDTAWPHRGQLIKAAAESLFGTGTRPEAIVLTHIHPDHAGSARELAGLWDLPVHVHPAELPLAAGRYMPQYGNPLDRWLIAPLLALMSAPGGAGERVTQQPGGHRRAVRPGGRGAWPAGLAGGAHAGHTRATWRSSAAGTGS